MSSSRVIKLALGVSEVNADDERLDELTVRFLRNWARRGPHS